MSATDWGVFLVATAAVASNLFVILYAAFAPWYGSVFGRALMTGEVALAVLLDVALYAHWSHTILPTWLILCVYGLIALGCWMRLGAVIHEQIHKRSQEDS